MHQGALKRPLPSPLLAPSGTIRAAAGTAGGGRPEGLLEMAANSGTTTTTTTAPTPKPTFATAPGADEVLRKDGDGVDGDGGDGGDDSVDGDGVSGDMGNGIASPSPPLPSSRLLFGRSLGRGTWWGRGGGGGSGSGSGALSSAGTTTDSDFANTVKAAEVSEAVSR